MTNEIKQVIGKDLFLVLISKDTKVKLDALKTDRSEKYDAVLHRVLKQ